MGALTTTFLKFAEEHDLRSGYHYTVAKNGAITQFMLDINNAGLPAVVTRKYGKGHHEYAEMRQAAHFNGIVNLRKLNIKRKANKRIVRNARRK